MYLFNFYEVSLIPGEVHYDSDESSHYRVHDLAYIKLLKLSLQKMEKFRTSYRKMKLRLKTI
jgi:hypothetical protein